MTNFHRHSNGDKGDMSVKASSAGSTSSRGAGLGRFCRGAFATRAFSLNREGSGVPSGARASVALMLAALALLLTPALASAALPEHPHLETFGSAVQPSFGDAAGMAVDPATGDLLVIDLANKTLHRYHADGTPDNFSDLGVNVIDGEGSGPPCTPPSAECDGTPQGGILSNEESGSGFSEVEVAVAPPGSAGGTAGDIYVTDAFHGVIDVFESTGKYLGQKSFTFPCGVAIDPAGNVYVGDYEEGSVHKLVPTAPATFTESAPSPFSTTHPCQVAAGQGFVYATEFAGKITKFDSEGPEEGAEKYVVDSTSHGAIGIDPVGGDLYTTNIEGNQIDEFDVSGASASTLVSTTPLTSKPQGVAVNGQSGNVYVTREGVANVEVFGPLPPPITITAVAPNKGPIAGSQSVTINGTNLTGATEVKFGTTAATGVSVNGAGTEVTATSPAHAAGPVDVTVVTPGGTSEITPSDTYTYFAVPTVTGVAPNQGPAAGGQSVTITGTNLTGATEVKFGTTAATGVSVNGAGTEVTATSPAHAAGQIDVTAVTPGGTSAIGSPDHYAFVEKPVVTEIKPVKGPTAGETEVEIIGTSLSAATKVAFGTTNVTTFTQDTTSKIKLKAPAHAAGTVDVKVTSSGGTSATNSADQYIYVAPLSLTLINEGSGSGLVTCDGGPCAPTYAFGAKVTLAASAAGCSGTGACTVTIEAVTAVTATFNSNPIEKSCANTPSLCPPPPPSNEVKLGSIKQQGEAISLKVTVPGAGSVSATGKNLKTAKVATKGAGSTTLKLKPSGAGKKLLKKKGKLKVKVTIEFTPTGGPPGTTTKTVTFKAQGKK